MSKSRSHSQSPPLAAAAKQEDIKQEDVKPEEHDVELPRETPPTVKPESSSPPPMREPSESSTPAPNAAPKRTGPQLIGDLPRAEDVARTTFDEIADNHYQYSTLGRAREDTLEGMTCDCQYEPGVNDPADACGHGSDCINRLTQVECLPEDCRCRSFCQNQRFQRKEYANVEIVLTEKKGYGLRAGTDIPKDTFIYEYVGEVVSHPSFMKRMREYAEEGILHFYFMMLQKDEYIDATKRGGIGRFANHSCSPNCYVAKWTVGTHVRMGIFAKRFIQRDEELTFNYNVDRYGHVHDAQQCYCGEPNCVGYLGGKTQTDIAAMDDLYLDALGITDEVEKLGLKGGKKRKSKKLDEDYMPEVKALSEKDVPKVVQAMRQTQSRKVLLKLLTRIKMTDNEAALRQIMRLRGFSLMNNILSDYVKDIEVSIASLEAMTKWPLIQRNKVEDSKIRVPVQVCAESENETMKSLATKLLEYWDTLEVAYRIPKRLKGNGGESCDQPAIIVLESQDDSRPLKKTRWEEADNAQWLFRKPTVSVAPQRPPSPTHLFYEPLQDRSAEKKKEIAAVIAAANAAAEAEAARVAAEAAAKAAAEAAAAAAQPVVPDPEQKKKKSPRKHQTKEEKEANKEKRLLKLIGGVVVKCMSKYAKQLDHDQFKKYAKELTHIIAEKEKKSSSYKEGKLDALSDEKTTKIKKFSKEYIAKVLRKLEKSRRKSSSDGPSHKDDTSNKDLPDTCDDGEVEMSMSVEQAMDLGSDDEADMDGAEDMQHSSDEGDPSPMEGVMERPPDSVTPMTPPDQVQLLDPHIRHQREESGWDPNTTALKEMNGIHA
ncbi:hypothetical protein ID866_7384 [Astraeus odoratus]|nr:hypothetical protein ID866_7384 [Astraeus odoratus]